MTRHCQRFLPPCIRHPRWRRNGSAPRQFREKATGHRRTMDQKWWRATTAGVSKTENPLSKTKKKPKNQKKITARKTKCDGGHPSCSSCARRSLTCNYVNDPNAPGGPRRKASTAASEPASTVSSGPVSAGPSSASASASGYNLHEEDRMERERERVENQPPSKRIRVEGGSTTGSTVEVVLGIP
jgi:hypothetical protein